MNAAHNPWAQQNRFEFNCWLGILRAYRATSLLEIGSCFGHSIVMMARVMPTGSRIISVDLGYGTHDLTGIDTLDILRERLNYLRRAGYEVDLIEGDSQNIDIVRRVSYLGPFDVCFIDGDHSFQGVMNDWNNYGRVARVAAFHDIVNPSCEVNKVWDAIKSERKRSTIEIVGSQMGIGVVFNEWHKGDDVGSEFSGWDK